MSELGRPISSLFGFRSVVLRLEELGGVAVTEGPAHRLQRLPVALSQLGSGSECNKPDEKTADEQENQHDDRAGHRWIRPSPP